MKAESLAHEISYLIGFAFSLLSLSYTIELMMPVNVFPPLLLITVPQ